MNKGAVGLLMATLMWATYIEFSGMGDRAFLENQVGRAARERAVRPPLALDGVRPTRTHHRPSFSRTLLTPPHFPTARFRQLSEHLAEVSDICFFLLAASTIVEVRCAADCETRDRLGMRRLGMRGAWRGR